MEKYIKKQFESGEYYIESISQGYPIWWREFEEIINEANTLSDLNSRLMGSKTPFGLLPRLVESITVFNPFIFDFLTNNPDYLQCFYNGHIEGKKEFKKTYFIKYPNEQQIKVITRKFNDEFKETILLGQGFFNESNVTMAGFQNGILTAYWLFENSFLENQHLQTEAAPLLEDLPPQQTENPKPEPKETELSEEIKKLKSIWLAEPKLTVEHFLQKGIDKGFWNNDLELTLQRNSSTYGTGKTFLGNVFRAFRGWAIPNHLDYKEAGKIFCEVFNIEVKKSTKEPYKLFSSGNDKQIREVKRTFDVK